MKTFFNKIQNGNKVALAQGFVIISLTIIATLAVINHFHPLDFSALNNY